MTDAVLYDYWRSSASYRVRIALELKGIAYRREAVDLLAQAHKAAEHLARQPQGLVPALMIDGAMFNQSLAIIEYLEETRPEPRFLPIDPAGRQRVRALAHVIAMDIHPVCNTGVVADVLALAGGSDDMRAEWMDRVIGRGLAALETMLDHPATGRFCHGDAPGLADVCLVPQLYNARRWDVPVPPRLEAIEAECAKVEAFARAHPDNVRSPDGARA